MTEGPHTVHGMGCELAEPDWLPLTDNELLGILGRSDPGGLGRQPVVIWRSPRPMSAAALVRHGDVTVFVKRHHVSVRIPEQLAVEHEFATHLRTRGLPVPAVVRLADGRSVLRRVLVTCLGDADHVFDHIWAKLCALRSMKSSTLARKCSKSR